MLRSCHGKKSLATSVSDFHDTGEGLLNEVAHPTSFLLKDAVGESGLESKLVWN